MWEVRHDKQDGFQFNNLLINKAYCCIISAGKQPFWIYLIYYIQRCNMNITSIGRFLRKLRIDHSEIMKDMAGKFGMTSAYLSAIELGKRPLPKDFIEKVLGAYSLSEFETKALEKAVVLSASEISISLDGKTDEEKELIVGFARTLGKMDEARMQQLKDLLGGNNE